LRKSIDLNNETFSCINYCNCDSNEVFTSFVLKT